jgi:hypothetical protein
VIGNDITREGAYFQVAYRPYDCPIVPVSKAEVAFRYSYARFKGVDPTTLDLTTFDTPLDVPINRNQYAVGLNYYPYPSMVLKFAYEWNHELGPVQLRDNSFVAQFAWNF